MNRPFGATLIYSSDWEKSESSVSSSYYAGARLHHNGQPVADVSIWHGGEHHPGPCLFFWGDHGRVIFSLKLPLTRESVMEAFARMVEQSLQEPQG